MLQTQISTTIPQTSNWLMQFHRVPTNTETSEINFFHGRTCIQITTIKFLGKHAMQTNPSRFDKRLFSDIYLWISCLKQGREIQDFMFWGKGPEGHSSDGYASFKLLKSWPWHVELIPGVSVVGLVTNEELCKVVWGIIMKDFMHKYSFIVSELLW